MDFYQSKQRYDFSFFSRHPVSPKNFFNNFFLARNRCFLSFFLSFLKLVFRPLLKEEFSNKGGGGD